MPPIPKVVCGITECLMSQRSHTSRAKCYRNPDIEGSMSVVTGMFVYEPLTFCVLK